MRRFGLLLLGAVLLVPACGGGDDNSSQSSDPVTTTRRRPPATKPAPKEPEELVVKYGFTEQAPDVPGTPLISYGVTLENPNDDKAASDVTVRIAFYDAANTIVDVQTENASAVLPKQKSAVGDDAQAVGAVRMEVQTSVGEWVSVGEVGSSIPENISVTTVEYGRTRVTGTLRSNFEKEQAERVTAIFYDSAGQIVGGAFTFIESLPPEGTAPFEITEYVPHPDLGNVEVISTP